LLLVVVVLALFAFLGFAGGTRGSDLAPRSARAGSRILDQDRVVGKIGEFGEFVLVARNQLDRNRTRYAPLLAAAPPPRASLALASAVVGIARALIEQRSAFGGGVLRHFLVIERDRLSRLRARSPFPPIAVALLLMSTPPPAPPSATTAGRIRLVLLALRGRRGSLGRLAAFLTQPVKGDGRTESVRLSGMEGCASPTVLGATAAAPPAASPPAPSRALGSIGLAGNLGVRGKRSLGFLFATAGVRR
jgi:hypothetical protein